ncbi:MAG: hypothetical protein JW874_15810, partial [Spirochaetales bacterium]|nr:hypothetical protein [Spirochaetales bacterium]
DIVSAAQTAVYQALALAEPDAEVTGEFSWWPELFSEAFRQTYPFETVLPQAEWNSVAYTLAWIVMDGLDIADGALIPSEVASIENALHEVGGDDLSGFPGLTELVGTFGNADSTSASRETALLAWLDGLDHSGLQLGNDGIFEGVEDEGLLSLYQEAIYLGFAYMLGSLGENAGDVFDFISARPWFHMPEEFADDVAHAMEIELPELQVLSYSLDDEVYARYLKKNIVMGNDVTELINALEAGSDLAAEMDFFISVFEAARDYNARLDGNAIDYIDSIFPDFDLDQKTYALLAFSGNFPDVTGPRLGMTARGSLGLLAMPATSVQRQLFGDTLESLIAQDNEDLETYSSRAFLLNIRKGMYTMLENGNESYRSAFEYQFLNLEQPTDLDEEYENDSDTVNPGVVSLDDGNIAHVDGGGWYDNMLLERYNQVWLAGQSAVTGWTETLRSLEFNGYTDPESGEEVLGELYTDEYFDSLSELLDLNDLGSSVWGSLGDYSLLLDVFQSRNAKKLSDHDKARNEWISSVNTINSIKSEIAQFVKTLRNSALTSGELLADLNEARQDVESAVEDYDNASDDWDSYIDAFSTASSDYNTQYEAAKEAYDLMEEQRLVYERADAILTFAKSGYLLDPNEEETSGAAEVIDAGGTLEELEEAAPAVDPSARLAEVQEEYDRALMMFNVLHDLFLEIEDGEEVFTGPPALYGEDAAETDDEAVLAYRQAYDDYREYYIKAMILEETDLVMNVALTTQTDITARALLAAQEEIQKLVTEDPADEEEGVLDYTSIYNDYVNVNDNWDSRWYWIQDMARYIEQTDRYDSIQDMLQAWGKVYAYEELGPPWESTDFHFVGFIEARSESGIFPDGKKLDYYRSYATTLANQAYNAFTDADDADEQALYAYFKKCYKNDEDRRMINFLYEDAGYQGDYDELRGEDVMAHALDIEVMARMVQDLEAKEQVQRDVAKGLFITSASLYAAGILMGWCPPVAAGLFAGSAAALISALIVQDAANDVRDALNDTPTYQTRLAWLNSSKNFVNTTVNSSVDLIADYQSNLQILNDLKGITVDGTKPVTLELLSTAVTTAYSVQERSDDLPRYLAMLGRGDDYTLDDFLLECYSDLIEEDVDEDNMTYVTEYDDVYDFMEILTIDNGYERDQALSDLESAENVMSRDYDDKREAFLDAWEDYADGEEITAEEVQALAEELYRNTIYNPEESLKLKYALYADLSERVGLENNTANDSPQGTTLGQLLNGQVAAMMAAFADRNENFMQLKQNEIAQLQEDFKFKYKKWQDTLNAILWRGRHAWNEAEKDLLAKHQEWTDAFVDEYEEKGALWDEEYLDFLVKKQKWVDECTVKASQVGSAQVLNDMGMSADLALSSIDSFVVSDVTIDQPMIDEIMAGLIDMDMMDRLIDAARDNNSIINTVQTNIFSYIKFDSQSEVLAAIKDYQSRDTSDIEKHTAIMMADQAMDAIKAAEETFLMQIEMANAGFDMQMDTMFLGAGYEEVSETEYEKRILVSATVLGGNEYKTVRVRQYVPFEYTGDDLAFPREISMETLENLSAHGIQALIDEVTRHYAGIREKIFDETVDDDATKARMEAYIDSLDNLRAKQDDEGNWIFYKPDTEVEDVVVLDDYGQSLSLDNLGDGESYLTRLEEYLERISEARIDGLYESLTDDMTIGDVDTSANDYYEEVIRYLFFDEEGEEDSKIQGMQIKQGLFNKYIGYAPVFYADGDPDAKDMSENTQVPGDGELGRLMTEFQKYMLIHGRGMAEFNTPL